MGLITAAPPPDKPCATVAGFTIHAASNVDGRDRSRLERLCRYLARPPLSTDRLERLDDGRLRYRFKKPWADGTRSVVLQPMELINRLSAMVPPPRFHMLRLHGLLAPHALGRSKVVPGCPTKEPQSPTQLGLSFQPPLHPAQTLCPAACPSDATPTGKVDRIPWAKLLRRVFKVDLDAWFHCGGPMKIRNVAVEAQVIDRILVHHELGTQVRRPLARAPPPQLALPW